MSEASDYIPLKFLPQLPGYKTHDLSIALSRPQIFHRVHGESFVKDGKNLGKNEQTLEESSILSIGTRTRPGTASKKNDLVLTFQAYYDDLADGTGPLVRQNVYIYFFAEDNSIKIVVAPKVRGGSKSGIKLRRTVVLKEDGTTMIPDDFELGKTIVIYGRAYTIIDCNETTRDYLRQEGLDSPISRQQQGEYDHLIVREDSTTEIKEWGAFRPKKNQLKIYMEAKMGNTPNNSKRKGFMAFGNKTLRFLCYWSNSGSPGKAKHEYVITYHLADDTADITIAAGHVDGGECRQLLKRSKLLRDMDMKSENDEFFARNDDQAFYHWSDLEMGTIVTVFRRSFIILDADSDTRSFYNENGIELGPAQRQTIEPKKIYQREIPPHIGFGSEEDSMRSCVGSLRIGPARAKKVNPNAQVLVFVASIVSDNPDNAQRKFVITFYTDDGTMKILEPPQRNSGFVGGMFLSRQKMKSPEGRYFVESDFRVGNIITVSSHTFLLTDADAGTQTFLHSNEL
jgi:hypothetical protein